jgi:large subunit ribosomal protein L1
VIVFAKGDKIDEAKAAGADEVGGAELADKIKGGWTEFDVCIAAPDMMGVVGPLGKVLGPRGLMPSPRAGTVTPDVAKVIKEYKAGKVEFRCDAGGNVHAVAGKMSFDAAKLVDNITAFIHHIEHIKPAAVKGQYVKGTVIKGTMTVALRIQAA